MSDLIKCPSCEGRRTALAMVDGVQNGKRFGKMMELACHTCDGKGAISAGHAERIDEGKRMREDRFARGMSLRDEAKRLGISPSELSDRENGRLRTMEDVFSELGREGK